MSNARSIDIEHLTLDELVELNERVIERIQYLERVHVAEAMRRLNLGTRVRFESSRDGPQTGRLAKFNQKSVTVLTDDGKRWNVPPKIVEPIDDTES